MTVLKVRITGESGCGRFSRTVFMRNSARVFITIGLFVSCAIGVSAFTLTPISREFSPAGQGATQTFRIDNPSDSSIAVKIRMVARHMSEDGHESYTDASNSFVVFPSRIVVGPRQSQSIRVQWRGPADITSERAYRIIAEQLPVAFGDQAQKSNGIRILFRYLGAVYVAPRGVAPDVQLRSYRPETDADGRSGIELVFENNGTAHSILSDLVLTIAFRNDTGKVRRITLSGSDLQGVTGENLLAGHRRRFFVPVVGKQLTARGLHVEYSYRDGR